MIGKKTVIQVEENELRLEGLDIGMLLRSAGLIPGDQTIDSVTFRVPGGGDYSNMNVEIDADAPVIVKWTTRKKSEEKR